MRPFLAILLLSSFAAAGTVTLTWTQSALPPDWAALASYTPGQVICPVSGNAGNYEFFAQQGAFWTGVSGSSAPTWTQTPNAQTSADGGVTDWMNSGNTCPPVTSNNVYRSTTSGGPYTEIYSSSSPIATYSDTPGSPGVYYYVVTSVSANGESANSNEAPANDAGDSGGTHCAVCDMS